MVRNMGPKLTISGDRKQERFEEIYEALNKMVYYYALKIVKDHGLAEDATQEAFMRLSRNMEKVAEGPDSPQTQAFLLAIVRHTALDALSQRGGAEADIDEMSETLRDERPTPEEIVLRRDSLDGLMEQIESQGEEMKSLLIYRYVCKMKVKEISDMTGMNAGTVSVKLGRMRKRLFKMLQGREGEANG